VSSFYRETVLLMTKSVDSFYPDNFDREIRQLGTRRKVMILLEALLNRLRRMLGVQTALLMVNSSNYYLRYIDQFEATFDILGDQESRRKYVELLLYRMLGSTKVKLSLNTEEFWAARARTDAYVRPERIPVSFRNGYLELYDLSAAGYDIKLFFVRNGVYVDFILQQYNYQDRVCVNHGDIVIDAGGCWGDTALYFSARGADKVFVYEFIPSNLAILEKNAALNPRYDERIVRVNKAVWESSGMDLSFEDRGPASRVADAGVYAGTVQTLSIDDLVREQGLSNVDFIKMDIEGAELPALKGAAETIRRYKPKLAISAYHRPDDLVLIPKYIQSLNPDYEFYLDYYTIVGDEIMLYAIDKHAE
jgi:FkbM family methyltransferase